MMHTGLFPMIDILVLSLLYLAVPLQQCKIYLPVLNIRAGQNVKVHGSYLKGCENELWYKGR